MGIRMKDRRQKTEDRHKKLEVRGRRSEVYCFLFLTFYFLLFPSSLLLLTSYFSVAFAQESPVESPDMEAGKKIYEKRCIHCHGPEGRGNGPAAHFLNPPPTNLARARYKYHSTPEKSLPTDEDLIRTVSKGLPGTAMPAWEDILSEQQRHQVVQYIKTFSRRFTRLASPPQPVPVGKPIPATPQSIKKGSELYFTLECHNCHGDEGRADGPNAPEQTAWPLNLTQRWFFRGGSSREDLYLRITTGAGAMPSFEKDSTEEERWHLVNYVLSLSPEKRPSVRVILKARRLEGAAPTDPDDPHWEEAEFSEYPLIGQVIQEPRLFTPTIRTIQVRAMYNTQEVAIRLSWDDPTQSKEDPERETYPDGVAIQFPLEVLAGSERPYFLRGNDRNPVYVWHWRNDQTVKESNFRGLMNEEIRPSDAVRLLGQGIYHNGQYRVVLRRSLRTNNRVRDLQFPIGQLIPLAFSVWDGDNGETKGEMAVSHWYYLLLEPPPSPTRYVYPSILAVLMIGIEWWAVRRFRRQI